jgi:hypothetical protein
LGEFTLLHRHCFRHGKNELITFGRAGEGKPYAGVTAGWLNHRAPGFEFAVPLGGLQHGRANTTLDAVQGIKGLCLGKHSRRKSQAQFRQLYQRRVSSGFGDIAVDFLRASVGLTLILNTLPPD